MKPRLALSAVVRMNREIEFSSHAGNLSLMRKFVREYLAGVGCGEAVIDLMVLGIDEACTNVIRYAYANEEDQLIRLSLERTAGGVRCRLRDYGTPVDAAKLNGRSLEVVRPGGLGLYLIRQAFDKVYYLRRPKGTEMVMTRELPAADAADSAAAQNHRAA